MPICEACGFFSEDVTNFSYEAETGAKLVAPRSVARCKPACVMKERVAASRDKAVVLPIVAASGLLLKYAHVALKGDRDIVLAAVRQAGTALQYASESRPLGEDEELGGPMLGEDFLPSADREVVLTAVKNDWRALQFASAELKADKQLVMMAINIDWRAAVFILTPS